MSVSPGDFLRALHEQEVEIHHRGHAIALRVSGRIAYLPILAEGAAWPVNDLRDVIRALILDKALLGKRIPDLYGVPSKPKP